MTPWWCIKDETVHGTMKIHIRESYEKQNKTKQNQKPKPRTYQNQNQNQNQNRNQKQKQVEFEFEWIPLNRFMWKSPMVKNHYKKKKGKKNGKRNGISILQAYAHPCSCDYAPGEGSGVGVIYLTRLDIIIILDGTQIVPHWRSSVTFLLWKG